MKIEKMLYIDEKENTVFDELLNCSYFDEQVMYHYKNFSEKMRKPDLLGKTVQVTRKQFPEVYECAEKISKILEIDIPDIYIYEDFYYGIEAKGSDNPWIEISAKTITDLSQKELKFLMGREMCAISLKHVYYDTLIEESLSALEQSNIFPGTDVLADTLKATMYRWRRISSYTEDNFGYLVCRDLKSCIKAILKLILNNTYLADNVNISEYVKQSEAINELDDLVYNHTKMDEKIPYGPFRVKKLISYASSKKGIEALKLF